MSVPPGAVSPTSVPPHHPRTPPERVGQRKKESIERVHGIERARGRAFYVSRKERKRFGEKRTVVFLDPVEDVVEHRLRAKHGGGPVRVLRVGVERESHGLG
tara:strand:- start:57 stop:362 length:306 start_codon:yes stop_codon:yes gene_type:complete